MKTKIMTIMATVLMIGALGASSVSAGDASLTDAEIKVSEAQAQVIALDAASIRAEDATAMTVSDSDIDAVEAWIVSFNKGQFSYTYYVDKGTGQVLNHVMQNDLH